MASFEPSVSWPAARGLAGVMAVVLVVALVLPACTSTAVQRPAPPATTGPDAVPTVPPAGLPRAAPLQVERLWLQSWFKGTPVSIVERADGLLAVDVPRTFCFDPGSVQVKPALGAVLDKVAESLRRQPQLRLAGLAAPGDGSADVALAERRAAQVRQHLRSRGVAEARLGRPAAAAVALVQLRLQAAEP